MDSHIIGIHHIGIVAGDIRAKSAVYRKIGYTPECKIIHEVSQRVYVQFLNLGAYRIELIQPEGRDSPVYRFLQRGGGLNHICYESDDIEASARYLRREYGMLPVSSERSISIRNSRVTFLAKPNGEVIELVQFYK